jgi:hypothetical protein
MFDHAEKEPAGRPGRRQGIGEKLYAVLLKIHSKSFREAYGDEAMQLYRDRAAHETGFIPRLRLWLDLLADLVVSVPRGYAVARASEFAGNPVSRTPDGIPSFLILTSAPPKRSALLLGAIVSASVLAAIPASIQRLGSYRPPPMPGLERLRAAFAPPLSWVDTPTNNETRSAPAGMPALDAAERSRVIAAIAASLKEHYPDQSAAHLMASTIEARAKKGEYDAVADGPALASILTDEMRAMSRDARLVVIYRQAPLPDRPPATTPEGAARYQALMRQENCTFEKVEMLPHNIGYLKLDSFPEPPVCQATAAAAMGSLNRADAIIIDLRDNLGGFAGMVRLMAAYLFDHPVYLYNPREDTSRESWTQSPVSGNRLADKQAYVLVSGRTASAAEQFCYNLKMLHRATLVGETTRGVAHADVFRPIGKHFGMGIPEARAINPYATAGWEGTGVEPDVRVNAGEALGEAVKLAVAKLSGR